MGKKRRLSSTPSHKANYGEKARHNPFDDSVFERREREVVEPEVQLEEEKDEVGEARFRFYGALKGLTEKKANEDSTSESSLFDEEEHDEEDMFSDSQLNIIQDRALIRRYQ